MPLARNGRNGLQRSGNSIQKAPLRELTAAGSRVQCHNCGHGDWLGSALAHAWNYRDSIGAPESTQWPASYGKRSRLNFCRICDVTPTIRRPRGGDAVERCGCAAAGGARRRMEATRCEHSEYPCSRRSTMAGGSAPERHCASTHQAGSSALGRAGGGRSAERLGFQRGAQGYSGLVLGVPHGCSWVLTQSCFWCSGEAETALSSAIEQPLWSATGGTSSSHLYSSPS